MIRAPRLRHYLLVSPFHRDRQHVRSHVTVLSEAPANDIRAPAPALSFSFPFSNVPRPRFPSYDSRANQQACIFYCFHSFLYQLVNALYSILSRLRRWLSRVSESCLSFLLSRSRFPSGTVNGVYNLPVDARCGESVVYCVRCAGATYLWMLNPGVFWAVPNAWCRSPWPAQA